MPNIAVVDMAGKSVGEITLSDAVFGIKPNAAVMHAAVVNYLANKRQGTQSTLTRTEVSGGGKKPWRQKGTGHARQGSTRAPQWRHGGIVHAPKPRDYSYSLNKKVKRLALKSALSDKVLTGDMIVLDELKTETYKTKVVADCLKAIGAGKKTLRKEHCQHCGCEIRTGRNNQHLRHNQCRHSCGGKECRSEA